MAHLVDTAAVASALVDRWVPSRLLDDPTREAVVAAAGLHDLGKAGPVFQGQLMARRRDSRFADHLAGLSTAGLGCPGPVLSGVRLAAGEEQALLRRHEVLSAAILAGRVEDAGAEGLAALVAGHHGCWRLPFDDYGAVPVALEAVRSDPGWSAWHRDAIAVIEGLVGGAGTSAVDPVVVPVAAGVVVVADWLASHLADVDPSGVEGADGDWEVWFERRVGDAHRLVEDLLGVPVRPAGSVEDILGVPSLRPVQQAVSASTARGLRLVMAPTGEGKTEAAFGRWLAHHAGAGSGLLFALPTMATTDAMLERVRPLFADTDARGALAHGRSILNGFNRPAGPLHGSVHNGPGGLSPSWWFNGRGRQVLAPVTVCTVDQVLLSVLAHRHNFVRLLGVFSKMVVVDEVHTFDPYMSGLLERFLRWAGRFGVDVVLMSATLPAERQRTYVEAYADGPAGLPAAVYPSVVTCTGGVVDVSPVAMSRPARTVVIDRMSFGGPDDIARYVAGVVAAHPDAKVGVILNTVGRVQQVATALHALLGCSGTHADGRCGTLWTAHSRFPAAVRSRQTAAMLGEFGPDSTTGAAVLVATQVVEMSLDIDLDLLITDLCPAPSLVQRIGRLHRHTHDPAVRRRPGGMRHPRVVLVTPDPWPDGPAGWLPYPAPVIGATWEHGLGGGAVNELVVPNDVQAFVDRSHLPVTALYGPEGEGLADELVTHLLGESAKAQRAGRAAIPTPEAMTSRTAAALEKFANAEVDGLRLSTRWDDTPTALVLLHNPDGPPGASTNGVWGGPIPSAPGYDEQAELLGCTVTISGRQAFDVTPRDDIGRPSPGRWDGTLLHDVVPLPLPSPDWDPDPLTGLTRRDQ
ncbi:CRISPR-associated helicase Cas3 (plasmid) [Euzebya pacifica]|uniref:CRISPR-associated helicase Cas3 n=2 Tax=Euzebya pacifica TaxID=1608957 RepID=A0A346Y605_9ACTN|nr:CRISPR-associated helicase Cas3 [Euzebya pacifica]